MTRPSFGNRPSPTDPAAASTENGNTDLTQAYRRLRDEHARLNENRVRRTVMLQNAMDEDERCRREAQAFGAGSPEELEQILDQRRQEAARQLAEFEAALAEEARLQEQVEQDLAAAEKR